MKGLRIAAAVRTPVGRYVATLCIGVGQGLALVLER
jgi:acetyl-CoA acetyltransferase